MGNGWQCTYLFCYFFLRVTSPFDDLPELHELVILNGSVVVVVHCVKKLLSRYLSKIFRPMFYCFILFYRFRIVFVKDLKDFIDLGNQLRGQIL